MLLALPYGLRPPNYWYPSWYCVLRDSSAIYGRSGHTHSRSRVSVGLIEEEVDLEQLPDLLELASYITLVVELEADKLGWALGLGSGLDFISSFYLQTRWHYQYYQRFSLYFLAWLSSISVPMLTLPLLSPMHTKIVHRFQP